MLRLFACFAFAAVTLPGSSLPDRPENLSPRARASASAAAPQHPARLAADGRPQTWWESGASPGAWLELTWDSPVAICEIVVQRAKPEPPAATPLIIQVFREGRWEQVWAEAAGAKTDAIVLARFGLVRVGRIRISEFPAHSIVHEVAIYENSAPPFLDVRGDAVGNMIGVFTDSVGSAGIIGEVCASGIAGGRPWSASAKTDDTGAFRMPLPVGLAGPVRLDAKPAPASGFSSLQKVVDSGDLHQGLRPRPDDAARTLALNGKWRFGPDPPPGFEKPEFADEPWSDIAVPAHWSMQGFQPESGIGGYRKRIAIPANWKGTRIRLAFDGVYSGAEVWWNGHRVGSHMGGATPFQLDVTSATRFGADNLLAVRVIENTMASELDNMSGYADLPLAGIFRAAYVFAVPETHVARAHSFSEFEPGYGAASLVVDLALVNESASAVKRLVSLRLRAADGPLVATTDVAFELAPWSKLGKRVSLRVSNPSRWTAEHPNLYALEVSVPGNSAQAETVTRRVGFRETRIAGTRLLVNGVPIKLKGTCHHDSHPLMGRAVTPELERLDVTLMKEANLDAFRTSHYPPLPELLDAADELGMYVEDEASLCWVYNASDLRYSAITRQLTSEMVERDRSHPSVIYWSAGNESGWGPTLLAGERMIRDADPTRPVVGSWSNHFDMEIRHNPITVEQIRQVEPHTRPVIWDESLGIFQGIYRDGEELWRDPGYRDYYVSPLIDVMDAFWKSKVTRGSFIWAWSDDLFAAPGRASEYGRRQTLWHGVDRQYTAPGAGLVGDAPWGVVDGWRRRKPEFWHIRKLHSPIRVEARELPSPVGQELRIPVENRYFFTNLSELSAEWSFAGASGTVRTDIAPQSSGLLPIQLPAASGDLELRFRDARGAVVDEFRIRVGKLAAQHLSNSYPPLRTIERTNLADEALRIIGDRFEIAFSLSRGLLRYGLASGRTLLYAAPHIRVEPIDLTLAGFPQPETWTNDGAPEVTREGDNIVLTVHGGYANLHGSYRTVVAPSGDVKVEYAFRYTGPDVRAREIGMRLSVPVSLDTLEWTRRGEWTWYPEDHIGATHGVARAHTGRPLGQPDWPWSEDDSPLGSNGFRSTKRNFLTASLRDVQGAGIALSSDGSQHLRATVESDRIALRVSEWFGGTFSAAGEWTENYGMGRALQTGDDLRGAVTFRLLIVEQLTSTRKSPNANH